MFYQQYLESSDRENSNVESSRHFMNFIQQHKCDNGAVKPQVVCNSALHVTSFTIHSGRLSTEQLLRDGSVLRHEG